MAQLRLTIGDIAVTNEHVTSTVTIDKQTYNVSLIGLSFQKKMYQPTEVLAALLTSAVLTFPRGGDPLETPINREFCLVLG